MQQPCNKYTSETQHQTFAQSERRLFMHTHKMWSIMRHSWAVQPQEKNKSEYTAQPMCLSVENMLILCNFVREIWASSVFYTVWASISIQYKQCVLVFIVFSKCYQTSSDRHQLNCKIGTLLPIVNVKTLQNKSKTFSSRIHFFLLWLSRCSWSCLAAVHVLIWPSSEWFLFAMHCGKLKNQADFVWIL